MIKQTFGVQFLPPSVYEKGFEQKGGNRFYWRNGDDPDAGMALLFFYRVITCIAVEWMHEKTLAAGHLQAGEKCNSEPSEILIWRAGSR